ncbi:Transcription factor, K-box [Cynara cardunculus var. scolymus]|uniref:Transcription factor, K-box n=1 Tax=Cynara cardunculus var. scolymus TaxID=59895 RepID=A0A103XMC7_CYNCS|nr:Transcription factor, K-box [Cynara cardunculus var. scolymus]
MKELLTPVYRAQEESTPRRQLLGEELSGLNVNDLQKLEIKLEMSLKALTGEKTKPKIFTANPPQSGGQFPNLPTEQNLLKLGSKTFDPFDDQEKDQKQEQVLMDEVKELNHKGSFVGQENKELHEKVNLLRQENTKLQKEVYELWSMAEATKSSTTDMHHKNYELHAPINLQLSQPQPQKNCISVETMKLG